MESTSINISPATFSARRRLRVNLIFRVSFSPFFGRTARVRDPRARRIMFKRFVELEKSWSLVLTADSGDSLYINSVFQKFQ